MHWIAPKKILIIILIVVLTASCSLPNNWAATSVPAGFPSPTALIENPEGSTPTPDYGQSVHLIQSKAHISPLNGQPVNDVHGVITAVRSDGFYLQDPNPDQDHGTSEGIFVFTERTPDNSIGDEVLVSGLVDEFYPGGIATGNLSITEIKNPRVKKIAQGRPLPTPVVIGRGGRVPPSQVIKGDRDVFDPDGNGLDFYESMESMLVQVNQAVVVGPTNEHKETVVIADSGKDAGLRTPRGGIILRLTDSNPERIIIDDLMILSPDLNVGDVFTQPLVGILDYSFGNFKLQLTKRPTFQTGNLQKEIAPDPGPDELSIASMNVQNLDPEDGKTRFDNYARLIVIHLKSPDILSLNEVQDNNGKLDDPITDASLTYRSLIAAIKAVGGPTYDYRDIPPARGQDGGEIGGNIRAGFLYRTDREIQFVDRGKASATEPAGVRRGSSGMELTLSPGRIDPNSPAFFSSRKPLVGEFLWKGQKIFLIGLHLNSKGEDSPLFGRYQPPVLSSEKQRVQQAEVIQAFISKILAADDEAKILALGDFNDFQFSNPVTKLVGKNMKNLVLTLPESQQYSYVFDGNSQMLDQMAASYSLAENLSYFAAIHINAEFAYNRRLSDHDPILVRFLFKP